MSSNGTEKAQREANGRFAVGNKLATNGGRPPGWRSWVNIIQQEVTPEKWTEIVLHAIAEASGRVPGANVKAAREFLARYVAPSSVVDRIVSESLREEDGPFGRWL